MPNLSMETTVDTDRVLHVVLPSEFPIGAVRITFEPVVLETHQGFHPQTDLGRRLWEIRQRAIASGMKLLSQDEVLAEVRQRRGESDQAHLC
ncbi:MAG: hypothetical protein HQL87_05365 [Magnetococcales bacterium]|nr:hypothetical protein [Magnetococcales bacterium]